MSWVLPSSPDAPAYREALREIQAAKPADAIRMRAALCKADYYAYLKLLSSWRNFRVKDNDHWLKGGLWIDHPWVFDRARELQQDMENQVDDKFYNWARFHMKTSLITIDFSVWEIIRDRQITIAIITHKKDEVGQMMFDGARRAMTGNPLLPVHYPQTFAADGKYPLDTNSKITVLRDPGPKEPTLSFYSIDELPAGGHWNRIRCDDCVVAASVDTPGGIEKTKRQMRRVGPLATDDTLVWWIGTIWSPDDPYNYFSREDIPEDEKLFTCRSLQPGMLHPDGLTWNATSDIDEWAPQLRSMEFMKKQKRKLGAWDFASQVQQVSIAKSDQGFDPTWMQSYQNSPRTEAKGKQVVMVIDSAGGRDRDGQQKKNAGDDFWVFRIYALGGDKNLYAIDLWRERVNLGDAMDLAFALVSYWKPDVCYAEDYGQTMLVPAMRREMEFRKFRFNLSTFPAIKRPKEARIQLLQKAYREGRIFYPKEFGHGSGPRYVDALRTVVDPKGEFNRFQVNDGRDTKVQFLEDEYKRWTPQKRSIPHDDMLDGEAWMVQPESPIRFPETVAPEPEYNLESGGGHSFNLDRLYASVSWEGL